MNSPRVARQHHQGLVPDCLSRSLGQRIETLDFTNVFNIDTRLARLHAPGNQSGGVTVGKDSASRFLMPRRSGVNSLDVMQRPLVDAIFSRRQRAAQSLYALGCVLACWAYANRASAQPATATATTTEPAVVAAQPLRAASAQAPTAEEQQTQQQGTQEPVTQPPAAQPLTTDTPVNQQPTADAPVNQQPTTDTPVTEAPTTAVPPPRAPAAARPSLFTGSSDFSEPDVKRPSNGIANLVTGGVLTGLGVLNAVGFGVCFLDAYPDNARDACKVASAIVSGAGLAIGIPLLIVGSNQRADFKAWKEQHSRAPRLGVHAGNQSFGLNFAATF